MKKIIVLLLVIFSTKAYATYVDFIDIYVEPISVNSDNEILCMFMYEINELGGGPTNLNYGWLKISQLGEAHVLQNNFLDGNRNDFYDVMDNIREIYARHSLMDLPQEIKDYAIIDGYMENNAWKYFVNRVVRTEDIFRLQKGDIQKSLLNGRSVQWTEYSHILYSIGDVMIFANYVPVHNPGPVIGCRFDYFNKAIPPDGDYFTVFYITGWVNFKPQDK